MPRIDVKFGRFLQIGVAIVNFIAGRVRSIREVNEAAGGRIPLVLERIEAGWSQT